jgi:hypothetical protein
MSFRRVLGVAVVVAAAAWAAWAYWPRPHPETERKELVIGWRPILSQSGRETVQTESFQIDTGQWRIKWSAANTAAAASGANQFRVGVHSAVSGRLMTVAVDAQEAGEGVAYVAEEPRPFFLSIESSGFDWTVRVEEGTWGERQ